MKGGMGLTPNHPTDVWLRPERSSVGPKPEHSRAAIADAAIGIADQEGLAAVSIRRVAASIGAGAASLYRYVKSHDELVEVMMDTVSGEYRTPREEAPYAMLLDLARQGRAIMKRHPWLAPLLLTRPSMGPNSLRYLEGALSALKATDLPGPAKLQTVAMMSAITSAFVQNELGASSASGADDAATASHHQHLMEAFHSGNYPHLTAALSSSRRDSGSEDGSSDVDHQFDSVVSNYLRGAGITA